MPSMHAGGGRWAWRIQGTELGKPDRKKDPLKFSSSRTLTEKPLRMKPGFCGPLPGKCLGLRVHQHRKPNWNGLMKSGEGSWYSHGNMCYCYRF